jgi:hypothetical protein
MSLHIIPFEITPRAYGRASNQAAIAVTGAMVAMIFTLLVLILA